MYNTEVQSILL